MFHHLFIPKINCKAQQLEIRESLIHGRGVFSKKVFKPGQLIEKAPVILINDTEKGLLQHSCLHHYYFLVANAAYPVVMGLGYSSLYNHSPAANAVYSISLRNLSITIKACKKIDINEEITVNYNGWPNDDSPVIFSTTD